MFILPFSQMHYSIIIQGKSSNRSFIWNNPYWFNNHFITYIKVLHTSSNALVTNINQFNTLFNIKCESIMFDKRYYTLPHIIDMISQVQYTSISISNSVSSYGCIHIDSSCTMWMKNKWLWLIETEQDTIW